MSTLSFASSFGHIKILLHTKNAPHTCQYFMQLAEQGDLDDATLFRIVTNNGLQANAEPSINIVQIGSADRLDGDRDLVPHESTELTGIKHRRWTVSASRFGCGELYGSFFVCLEDEPQLDFGGKRNPDLMGFAAFGEVTEGFDTLTKLFSLAETSEFLSQEIPMRYLAHPESK
ncbi:MAG: peptidylprolyl isomerase [Gammaproteobacteria bacterium]